MIKPNNENIEKISKEISNSENKLKEIQEEIAKNSRINNELEEKIKKNTPFVSDSENEKKNKALITKKVNNIIEKLILRDPSQWILRHNRWK